MITAKKLIRYALDPSYRFIMNAGMGKYDSWSDEKYLQHMFKAKMHQKLDLSNPITYSEKLQWLKLYNRDPLYTTLVDKYEVKKYVSDKIGSQYIIPTLGVWDRFEDIDFDKLPNQFVLKCTHDSGGLVICKDKESLNIDEAKRKITKSLRTNYYLLGREWPYKNVKPRIIAEEFKEDAKTAELRDYKFFCFDGVVKALFIATDRQDKTTDTKFDFFDSNFNHLPFTNGHPNAKIIPEKPIHFDEMKELASILSEGMPHVRVDLYEINGEIYFGEMTFFHHGGMEPFVPAIWDKTFGDWIKLPLPNKR
ncbi:MAG: glycosyl transferase [Lachnospiraceae bacterium]|nr:glycosyl transferase [Lachnospiraceae bacterium]